MSNREIQNHCQDNKMLLFGFRLIQEEKLHFLANSIDSRKVISINFWCEYVYLTIVLFLVYSSTFLKIDSNICYVMVFFDTMSMFEPICLNQSFLGMGLKIGNIVRFLLHRRCKLWHHIRKIYLHSVNRFDDAISWYCFHYQNQIVSDTTNSSDKWRRSLDCLEAIQAQVMQNISLCQNSGVNPLITLEK